MSNWRDSILGEFNSDVFRLTVVADPDGLLLEEDILAGIRKRGFELIPFEDHIAFRYAYESRFRSRWDRDERTERGVVLRYGSNGLGSLPYDLLQAGRQLSFNLGDIFPNLSYPIVTTLDRGDLDALYDAQQRNTPAVSGDNATREFILRHVFKIEPDLIKKPSDLLRVLLRRHYRKQRIPTSLDERFLGILRKQRCFDDWPLESIIPEREAFFGFLQERWPVFLDQLANQDGTGIREKEKVYGFELPGPSILPFDHDDVRIYIDNLFLEGLLHAVPHEQAESWSKSWLLIGIRTDEEADRVRRAEGLLDALESSIPNEDKRHEDWFHFAGSWAELVALVLDPVTTLPEPAQRRVETLQAQIDAAFVPWLARRYAGLINLPPVPPVMLHHVPRHLARHVNGAKGRKAALVLIDGLAMHQWIVIRQELIKQRPGLRFRENAVFAWIPTITSVSRQAAFAGKPPLYFPDSIHTTDKEPALWSQFWMDQGLSQHEVAYEKGLGDGALDSVEEIIARPKTRVIALVVDKVDKIMHGMELGATGMRNQVRQWAGQPFMARLVDLLLEHGFRVYLTSDHGNIETSGCGRPAEGVVADIRGERVRVYSDSFLRGRIKKRFPDALEWPALGLPENYLPLLAPGRSAFVRKTEHPVGHGGATLEELVVPLVQIERRNT